MGSFDSVRPETETNCSGRPSFQTSSSITTNQKSGRRSSFVIPPEFAALPPYFCQRAGVPAKQGAYWQGSASSMLISSTNPFNDAFDWTASRPLWSHQNLRASGFAFRRSIHDCLCSFELRMHSLMFP